MPRLREVSRAEVTDPIVEFIYQRKYGDRDPVKVPGTATGAAGNWETVLAQSPEILEHIMRGFEIYQNPGRQIDPLLRELAISRVGWLCESQFVFSQHCKAVRRFGGTEDQVSALPSWQTSSAYSQLQRTVLAYADALALQHGRVPDALFGDLKNSLSEIAIIELTYFTTMYVSLASITRAFRLEWDDIPERVVEVSPPKDFVLEKAIAATPLKLPKR